MVFTANFQLKISSDLRMMLRYRTVSGGKFVLCKHFCNSLHTCASLLHPTCCYIKSFAKSRISISRLSCRSVSRSLSCAKLNISVDSVEGFIKSFVVFHFHFVTTKVVRITKTRQSSDASDMERNSNSRIIFYLILASEFCFD